MKTMRRRPLTIREILTWANAYRELSGKWPTVTTGDIPRTIGETWAGVNQALRNGLRSLPGGSSLAQLLAEECGARNRKGLPPSSEEQILVWADTWHERTGEWPTADSGLIPDSGGEKWRHISEALKVGTRGLSGGSSLARLLAEHRGVRNLKQLPPLSEEQILAWADAHYQRTGTWPTDKSGPVFEAPGETWAGVQAALYMGRRGMPGGSGLARLLAEKRAVRNIKALPNLSIKQILAWADAWHERTGKWPNQKSGPISEAPGETWSGIENALTRGSRGLSERLTLSRLLAAERGVLNRSSKPRLSRQRILVWAKAHFRRTGQWPTAMSGPILDAQGETWLAIDNALRVGLRGLQGGSSLARLLADHGAKRNIQALPPLSKKKIVAWAEDHFRRTGEWPNTGSGPVYAASGEQWSVIDSALRHGVRGLSGGSSLLKLLAKKRGIRNVLALPPLTVDQIGEWADLHYQRSGRWPTMESGPIADVSGETWKRVDYALRFGKRGLPSGTSLAKLLAERREERAGQPGRQDAGLRQGEPAA